LPVIGLTLPGIWSLIHLYFLVKHSTRWTVLSSPLELESGSEAMFLIFFSLLGLSLAKELQQKNKAARKVFLLSAAALLSLAIRHLGIAPFVDNPAYWLTSLVLIISGLLVLIPLWSLKH